MFRRIAADVNEKTNGRRNLPFADQQYYLNQKDRPVWDQIKDTSNPGV